jgi:hypothetical protein
MTPETQAGREEPMWEIVRDPDDLGFANFIDGGGFPWRIPVELLDHMDALEARIREVEGTVRKYELIHPSLGEALATIEGLEARNAVLEAIKWAAQNYLILWTVPRTEDEREQQLRLIAHGVTLDTADAKLRALLTPDAGKEADSD